MNLLKKYIEETINTKASQRRRISKLEKENGMLKEQLEEAKDNEEYAINAKNVLKDELTLEHKEKNKITIELQELKSNIEKYQKELNKISKELEKERNKNENERNSRQKKRI